MLLPAVPPSAVCWKPLGLFDNAPKPNGGIWCARRIATEHAKTERSVETASGKIQKRGLPLGGIAIGVTAARQRDYGGQIGQQRKQKSMSVAGTNRIIVFISTDWKRFR